MNSSRSLQSIRQSPLLPVLLALITGIIIGRYVDTEALTLLLVIIAVTTTALFLSHMPRIQTCLLWLLSALTGCFLISHPLPDIPLVQQAKGHMIDYRQQLLRQYKQEMTGKTYEVVAAMTLGDKTALTKETRQTFNATGASHILAISGLHLGIIYMVVSLLVRGRRWRMATQILTLLLLWTFAFLVGMSPSVVRAATMLTVYGLLSLGYRQKMSVNVLAFTAIVMLLIQPEALFNVGFQLSYMAVLAILLFYPMLYGLISEKWLMEHRLTSWLWGMTAVSIAAQAGAAPLIAFYFHRFSSYFLLSNFVVIPCAYLILIGGFVLLLTSWSLTAQCLAIVVGCMKKCLSGIATLPCATIENLYPSVWQTILVYILIFTLFYLVIRLIYTIFGAKYG